MDMNNKNVTMQEFHISVAPMMDWTDRHCRYFHRLISPRAVLYTEMVTTGALIHGDRDRFLRFDNAEHPLALQLGGSDPESLAQCALMAQDYGYDAVNLNCGCPSDRVQSGHFGACLMADPLRVGQCIKAMQDAVNIPVTVKCRIAIDEEEEWPFLTRFIDIVADHGCDEFIIHARKAWLNGLSPKQNRDVPPLRYDIAEKIKQTYPHLNIGLNGGIKTIEQITAHKDSFDSIMIGREIYQNPWFLYEIERDVFGNDQTLSRADIAMAMIEYIEKQQRDFATPPKSITRHMIGLFHGQAGGKKWRRYISENAHKDDVNVKELIESAIPKSQQSLAA
jgi:tRNA-dihydrouridine synthase A